MNSNHSRIQSRLPIQILVLPLLPRNRVESGLVEYVDFVAQVSECSSSNPRSGALIRWEFRVEGLTKRVDRCSPEWVLSPCSKNSNAHTPPILCSREAWNVVKHWFEVLKGLEVHIDVDPSEASHELIFQDIALLRQHAYLVIDMLIKQWREIFFRPKAVLPIWVKLFPLDGKPQELLRDLVGSEPNLMDDFGDDKGHGKNLSDKDIEYFNAWWLNQPSSFKERHVLEDLRESLFRYDKNGHLKSLESDPPKDTSPKDGP